MPKKLLNDHFTKVIIQKLLVNSYRAYVVKKKKVKKNAYTN